MCLQIEAIANAKRFGNSVLYCQVNECYLQSSLTSHIPGGILAKFLKATPSCIVWSTEWGIKKGKCETQCPNRAFSDNAMRKLWGMLSCSWRYCRQCGEIRSSQRLSSVTPWRDAVENRLHLFWRCCSFCTLDWSVMKENWYHQFLLGLLSLPKIMLIHTYMPYYCYMDMNLFIWILICVVWFGIFQSLKG